MDTETVSDAAAAWYQWEVDSVLANDWYDGTKNVYGVTVKSSIAVVSFYSSEEVTNDSLRPYWVVYYSTEAGGEIKGLFPARSTQ